jgi:(1->4)-alpha-D-glucan 1-alpha-D-glucosylmutase
MSGRRRIPTATYRLQFNKSFRFEDARALVSSLNRLGISDIYASPILKARQGSSHGYDITDPTRLNPELGTERDFYALVRELRQYDMGLLLDIVPNHMAASPENPWWRDMQEKGQESPFAGFFDTNWLSYEGSSGVSVGHRRFFDIGDLIGVRVEDPQVFRATHSYILQLIAEGKVDGLRLDHIDGLYDPLKYLQRLGESMGGTYTVVEKILSGDEALTETWPVSGTTGYDFANVLNCLFVDRDGIKALNNLYTQVTGSGESFRELVYEKKKQVILELFSGEIDALGQWLAHLSGQFTAPEMSRALVEVTACLPVYRTYTNSFEVSSSDRRYIEGTASEAAGRKAVPKTALGFLKRVLLLDFPANIDEGDKKEWLNFVMRWQQLTGAIMAKGFEDTALYSYNRLISLNEVGGEPDSIGLSKEDFHRWNLERMKYWPHTLNATSTHDTKRSEDVRARISVLSEIPDEWAEHLGIWMKYNEAKKHLVNDHLMPEPNTELLLYQTLIGAWPLFTEGVPEFKERLKAYMIKAVREAKTITSWLKINQKYEEAILSFIDAVLEDSADNKFLIDFLEFQEKIAYYGALNSLSQLLLKIASPGVPDFYQGMELWDFSLVDPDNRRPVDLKKRRELLDNLLREEPSTRDLLASWKDGRIKLYVTYKALNFRRDCPVLFQKGDYIPLSVSGTRQEQVCVFARRYGKKWALVVAPRFFTKLSGAGGLPIGKQVWDDDYILVPEDTPQNCLNIFTGDIIEGRKSLPLAEVFGAFPVALLIPSA